MKYLFVLFGLLTSYFTNGQQIDVNFDFVVMEERFESINNTWPQIFNTENIALSQPGHYEMRRTNNESGNYVFPKIDKDLTAYEVLLNLEFTKNNSKGSRAGILVMSNEEKGTGILLELRRNRSYRISKTGEAKDFYYTNADGDGWVTDKNLVKKKKNIIKIKSYQRKYDIYFNDLFVYTFTEIAFRSGKFALFIGPNSHAYYNSFVLKTFPPNFDAKEITNTDKLNTEIADLKTKLKLQQNEIDRLTGMQENNGKNINEIKELNKEQYDLKQSIHNKNYVIDSLEKINRSLAFFKSSIETAPEGGAVSALSIKLEDLRQEKISLHQQLENYKIDLGNSNAANQQLKNEKKALESQVTLLESKINFLIRQIDWMNQKLQSDSNHFIDTVRNTGTGFNIDLPIYKEEAYDFYKSLKRTNWKIRPKYLALS